MFDMDVPTIAEKSNKKIYIKQEIGTVQKSGTLLPNQLFAFVMCTESLLEVTGFAG